MIKYNNKRIGIIEGQGTGVEVADIFKKIINTICKKELGSEATFFSFKKTFGYFPNTFLSLKKNYYNKDCIYLKNLAKKELKDLKNFYQQARENTIGLFRTAINAEILYYLRKGVKEVKFIILPIKIKHGIKRIIFIRDQIQGYYTNDSLKKTDLSVRGSFSYTTENFLILTNFIKEIIGRCDIRAYDLYFLYKLHLFGFELQKMIEKAVRSSGLKNPGGSYIFQPDTGFHKLLNDLPNSSDNKDLIVIAGNEIGDTLLETLIHYYKLGTKETLFSLNVAFVHKEKRLEVLQTIHGSADDIAGKNLLNPIATIRAAAYALENWLKIPSAVNRMENIIKKNDEKKFAKIVTHVLSHWA